jgi:hypothetical protein
VQSTKRPQREAAPASGDDALSPEKRRLLALRLRRRIPENAK